MATLQDLQKWIERDLYRHNAATERVHEECNGDEPSGHYRFKVYTDTNCYSVTAKEGERGYLGCSTESRKPRAGEDWHRGNDLRDGPLTEEVWRAILADIVSYELVKVHRQTARITAEMANREVNSSPGELCEELTR